MSNDLTVSVLDRIYDDLGVALRHLFPGVLILISVYAQPNKELNKLLIAPTTQQIVVLAAISLAIGNLAYCVNRYLFLGLIEFTVNACRCMYGQYECNRCMCSRCEWVPFPCRCCITYIRNVAKEIYGFYDADWEKTSRLIRWRDSAAVYLLVGGEAFLLFASVHSTSCLWWMCIIAGLLTMMGGSLLFLDNRYLVQHMLVKKKRKKKEEKNHQKH